MSHVVRIPRPAFTALHGALRVFQVPALKDNLVWLVQCAKTGDTWAVDGPGADEALAACETHGLRLVGILNTHTHGDHIGINKALAKATPDDEVLASAVGIDRNFGIFTRRVATGIQVVFVDDRMLLLLQCFQRGDALAQLIEFFAQTPQLGQYFLGSIGI